MKLYDLSHPLNSVTPVYPGQDPPGFKVTGTIEKDGFREMRLSFQSHFGTHIDAPGHMLKDGKFLDQLSLESFTGKALIIHVPADTLSINLSMIISNEKEIGNVDFVLFKTDWSRFWGKAEYYTGFPVLSAETARWLCSFSLKGIGFDTISIDPADSSQFNNHHIIFNRGIIIIENLIFPEDLHENSGYLYCFPLAIENADGSPVRAVFRTE